MTVPQTERVGAPRPRSLGYAVRGTVPRPFNPYPVAITCGLLPLLTGTAIFFAWVVNRKEELMVAGVLTIAGGMMLFLIGLAAVHRYAIVARGDATGLSRRDKWRVRAALMLLLVNFPAAFLYARTADGLFRTHTVVVTNWGNVPVDSVMLAAHGARRALGPISPGRSATAGLRPRSDGPITYEVHSGGQVITGTVTEYASNGVGGRHSMTVRPTGVTTP